MMQATVIERRRDGKKSSFADSVAYILSDRDEHRSRDKLSHYELVNLTSRETAAAEMTLTAGHSDRCADSLHHIVISWPEGEQPSRQQAQEAARHHVRRLVDAHNDAIRQAARRRQETSDRRHRPRGRIIDPDTIQMVIAGHDNTRNSHVHVVWNRVDPVTGTAVSLGRDWITLSRASREMEVAQGWSYERGAVAVEEIDGSPVYWRDYKDRDYPPAGRRAESVERATGEISLKTFLKGAAQDVMFTAGNWTEAHEALAGITFEGRPLRLERKGSGYVVGNGVVWAKASDMMGKACRNHVRRFGSFQPPSNPEQDRATIGMPEVTGSSKMPDRLLASYQAMRAGHYARIAEERKRAHETLRREQRMARETLRREARERWAAIRTWNVRGAAYRDLQATARALSDQALEIHHTQVREQRRALQERFRHWRPPTWRQWLELRTDEGDQEAEEALRRLRYRERRTGNDDEVNAIEPVLHRAVIDEVRETARHFGHRLADGSVGYSRRDTGELTFIDRSERIDFVADDNPAALADGLQLAADRWQEGIVLTGNAAFKRRAAAMAVTMGIRVANPELQEFIRLHHHPDVNPTPMNPVSQPTPAPQQIDARVPLDRTSPPRPGLPTKSRERIVDHDAAELDHLVRQDLVSYLEQRHGFERDLNGSTQTSIKLRRGAEIVVVKRRSDGVYVYMTVSDGPTAANAGTIIQFEQNRRNVNLGSVRRDLREYFGAANYDTGRPHTILMPEAAPDMTEVRRRWYAARQEDCCPYLEQRAISPATLRHYGDTVRVDAQGNALFAHQDGQGNLIGYEIKGADRTGFAKGGRRSLSILGRSLTPKRIEVVESGIDALSRAEMQRCPDNVLYISTGGTPGARALDQLRELAMRHPEAEIVIGTDRDVAGDRIARIIVERIGERSRVRREAPISKDWNENLQVRKAEATRKALTTLARNNRSMILSP
jgi:hypothetical protein